MIETEFEKEIKQWVDIDGLIGNKKNPEKWSTGNALLETAFVYKIAKDQKSLRWMLALEDAVARCFVGGMLFKNPGRKDEITHDDIVGFASVNEQLADLICQWGERTGWVLSNTGKDYFTANVKPIHQIYYKAASKSFKVSAWEAIFFWLNAILGILMAHVSGARMLWLMRNCRPPKFDLIFGPIFDLIFKRRFKSVKNVHIEYYNTTDHITVRYCSN